MEGVHTLIGRHDRPISAWWGRWLVLSGLVWILWVPAADAADASTNKPARVKVSGYGLFGNREMRRLLLDFAPGGKMPPVIDRTFAEDAALLLLARAQDEGYLHATLKARFVLSDGSEARFAWTNSTEAVVTNDFAARAVRFRLEPGVQFYYRRIVFDGLHRFSLHEANSYFVNTDLLLKMRRNRIFNPETLRGSLRALREAYARAGYQNATVTTNRVSRDESKGAVDVEIKVEEGLPSVARSVVVHVYQGGKERPELLRRLTPREPYSQLWQQKLSRDLQAEHFVNGFPDTTVQFTVVGRETQNGTNQVDLAARIERGPLIHLHDVIFNGNKRTRDFVLEGRLKLQEGQLLNRVEAERSRRRLARLGVFESVRLRYNEVGEDDRDLIFEFQEVKPISVSVLAGVGSYELLRGGVELEHRNIFGLAHSLRLRGMQSFKASKGDLLYTVPEVLGENVNLFLQGSGLRREEVSFTRKEYGGSLGVQKRLTPIATDLSLRYDYEFLRALRDDAGNTNLLGVEEARSAAIVLELNRDKRDQALLPHRGLRLFNRIELASASLGGNVDYQRIFLGGSYHIDLHGGRLIHLGLTHAVSFTFGGEPEELPFNKRFFPGGENSVRGYREGEASPLDAKGNQLGAETFTQSNIEFEQLLTKSWSVVTFFDAVGFAQFRDDYPWDEVLYSVGGGLRWRTLIGPMRLEYGYNLHRRSHDPAGTLHFSLGFPF
jgi:outer membrane protein assembly complex protein YaeT